MHYQQNDPEYLVSGTTFELNNTVHSAPCLRFEHSAKEQRWQIKVILHQAHNE